MMQPSTQHQQEYYDGHSGYEDPQYPAAYDADDGAGEEQRGDDFYANCDPRYLFCEHPQFTPVFCAVWWFADIFIQMANYLIWMRKSEAEDIYGKGRVGAYLAFVIIAMIVYFVVAGTMWLWAARHPYDHRDKKRKTLTGIMLLWLLCDMPLWAVSFNTIDKFGYQKPIQAVAFTANMVTFVGFGVVFWVTFLCWTSNRLNDQLGIYSRSGQTVKGSVHRGPVAEKAADADFGFGDKPMPPVPPGPHPAGQAADGQYGSPTQAPVPLPLMQAETMSPRMIAPPAGGGYAMPMVQMQMPPDAALHL
eukprot:TRINITY_DN48806_c0_g1_i1.p1 TRINITY_DN48806_c0_g1~~TRINITY_DN48806_c0_g1_i1.p1  ORF type:complete len:305 (+),score=91.74 TRINITY_DN48806_c0_g1_i1:52-966(+)